MKSMFPFTFYFQDAGTGQNQAETKEVSQRV